MMRNILLVVSVSVFSLLGSASAQYAPQVATQHTDFRLPRISDRKPVSLSDYRGKKVLLIQFASW